MAQNKVPTQVNLPVDWQPARVELYRILSRLAGGLNLSIDSLNNFVLVEPGDQVSDATDRIQTAIDTGRSALFAEGTYHCNNLTQSTDFQRFYGFGNVSLIKNANGPIITATGDDLEFNGIAFRGEAASPVFTGDNVVLSGNNIRLIDCGSRWAYARAVKCTGSHLQIINTCDIYQTTDATANGYDIEVGVSGSLTRYHYLTGIYSSQNTGGILFIDCGGHQVSGIEFGKLTVEAGTSPAGVNGGSFHGCRILGDVNIEISDSKFSGNAFGAVTITFAAGTSGHKLDASNTFENGYTIVNNSSSLVMMDTFDGYKPDTFTPVVQGTAGAGTATYTVQVGRYTRIGNRVFFNLRVNYNTHTGTGNTRVTGLPYAAEGTANNNSPCTIIGNSLTFSDTLAAFVINGNSFLDLFTFATGGALTAHPIDAAAELIISGHYET